MGVDASRMSPIDAQTSAGFVIKGSLSKIKLTNEYDFSLFEGGLKSLDMRVDGDFTFDVKFNGKGAVKFGYFSQAWNEVKDESVKVFGASAKLTGLSVKDKVGKFPLAGLVWSVPCPSTCPVITGKTQTPLRQAKALGVIVWLYLTAEGEFSLDGNLTLAHLNPAGLSVGIKKPYGSDFQMMNSLVKKNNSECLIEVLKLDGTAGLQLQAGITTDVDFFTGGVRIANAGADVVGLFKGEAVGTSYVTDKGNFCFASLGSAVEWGDEVCFSGGIGGGLIARAAAKVGLKINTSWKDASLDLEYSKQIPAEEDIEKEGRHGLWYYTNFLDTCEVETVTSATGRVWMDRNLGADRAATSYWDELAYGDLFQWGRLADGHEKRTSDTTTTLSSTDVPGHDKFILTSGSYYPDPDDWRSPKNDNRWQGVNGVNNPCPSGFRLPTANEWQAEINASMANFDSPLKLILTTGIRSSSDGYIGYPHAFGGYWSSTITDTGNIQSLILFENGPTSSSIGIGGFGLASGLSVRCIKD
ncbi:MAG: hypothetical protein D3916_09695 [Candidatus Electrothrix sp. MAN1_4]|nr:hypothetical protein [Candidatus Electrothrix sp. MAN1_4]